MTEGVVIPGWKIPDNCLTCPFFHAVVANGGHGSYIECTIHHRELPKNRLRELMLVRDDNYELRKMTLHGRLIDADALSANLSKMTIDDYSLAEDLITHGVFDAIDNMPTIIEAEEGE